MKRREALRRTALVMGTAVSVPAVTGILKGCTASDEPDWTPEFLTTDEVSLLEEIAERILPRTQTPGAIDAGIDRFADIMLKDCYPAEDQVQFRAGLKAINDQVQGEYGDRFEELDPEQKDSVVASLEEITLADNRMGMAYRTIKELTLLCYFTSEPGLTINYNYEMVPGRYEGCMTLQTGEKPWKGGRI